MATGGSDLTLDDWILQIGGLTDGGRKRLDKAGIVSLAAVKHLSLSDIDEIQLVVGDRGIFRDGWITLTTPERIIPTEPFKSALEGLDGTKSKVTVSETEKLYTIKQISEFFGGLPGSASIQTPGAAAVEGLRRLPGAGVKATLADVTTKTLAKDRVLNSLASSYLEGGVRDTFSIQDLTLSELAGLKGEKLLLPVHFATVLTACGYGED
jgi:hypothetical protein